MEYLGKTLKYTIDGEIVASKIAKQIEKKMGIKLMLENEGDQLAGYLNVKYALIDGKRCTEIEVNLFKENIVFEKDEKKRIRGHSLKTIIADDKFIKKLSKVIEKLT